MNQHQFFTGEIFDAYHWFGAHIEQNAVVFRTFAPNASRITLTGACNGWTETDLVQDGRSGFWSVSVPDARAGQFYKYRIYGPDGSVTEHCDPYGFAMELRPACCSIITDLEEYRFTDEAWMNSRTASPDAPLNIYEMHLGSWMRNPDDANGWYTYDEIARRLIPYLQENGYTHVEFLPLSEHPFDGSWGYQNTGFFAPTSRYGTPAQLKMLIDKLHHAGIGAIMDFVPVHFAVDSYGLAKYDGTHLYEYPHSAVGESEWGSYNFIHSRREVRCFLQSAADYWLTEFHFDGLRMDAVSRLIYWQGDPARGVNGDTLEFLKNMNRGLKARHPSALLIAEDSTAYPGVTRPVDEGGLGFDYKWDLGWMHDTLEFCQTQPDLRPRDHGKLLWSMHYFANEHYLLPLSHDEVVHGKAAIVQKMWGADECDKYAQARVMYLYMFTHPGKKLNFMGNELGQLYEWSEAGTLDWALAERPFHRFSTACAKLMWRIPRCTQIMRRIISGGWKIMRMRPAYSAWSAVQTEKRCSPCAILRTANRNSPLPCRSLRFCLTAMPRSSAAPERRLPSPARIVCVRLRCRDTVRFCSSCKIEKQPKRISFPLPYTITNC